MLNNWQTLSQSDYSAALYNSFLETETLTGAPDYSAYVDSRSFVSVGVCFNLTAGSVQAAVFAALGLVQNDPLLAQNQTLNADENSYTAQLKAAISGVDANIFNAILTARSQDTALTAVLGPLPTGLGNGLKEAIASGDRFSLRAADPIGVRPTSGPGE